MSADADRGEAPRRRGTGLDWEGQGPPHTQGQGLLRGEGRSRAKPQRPEGTLLAHRLPQKPTSVTSHDNLQGRYCNPPHLTPRETGAPQGEVMRKVTQGIKTGLSALTRTTCHDWPHDVRAQGTVTMLEPLVQTLLRISKR